MVFCDCNGIFELVIVGKCKCWVIDVDWVVLLLYVKGLIIGEIVVYFVDVYGVLVFKDIILWIIDWVIEEM